MESIARSSEQYAEAKKRESTMQEKRRESLATTRQVFSLLRIENRGYHKIALKAKREFLQPTEKRELHLMAVRCNSRIPRLRKYWKFREGSGGDFLPKGATQISGAPDSTLQLLSRQRHFRMLIRFAHGESRLSGRKR